MVQAAKRDADRLLRVGVVGVGVMGSNHARVFADLPAVRLVGVADPDGKQRDFVSRALGCSAFSGVEPDALRMLAAQPWKGNVRELENVLERAMVMGTG